MVRNNTTLYDLPSMNEVLVCLKNNTSLHHSYLKYLIKKEFEKLRLKIKNNQISSTREEILEKISYEVLKKSSNSLVNIINGTGIVLHTGFGRSPFLFNTLRTISKRMEGYVNLEFDLESGQRGDRQKHIREHLSAICNSESSLCVNNNAAAVMLAINEFAEGGEVIVSRGQLVEIGGSFRIPDIIEKSGAILKEVGTTNRTHINDYINAISKNTKLILWVHTSNYVIKGFTNTVPLNELGKICVENNTPFMIDWGSGSIFNMNTFGLANEIPIKNIMKNKPDILTFSGDKLIGGPQSGLVVGKKKYISALQSNPLYRVLRCDKITIGLIEETLRTYRDGSFTNNNITLKMLTTSQSTLKNRGLKILNYQTKNKIQKLRIKLQNSIVEAGSGSLPDEQINSMALSFEPKSISVNKLAQKFRCGKIPVVGYVSSEKFFIDLKAVLPNQVVKLAKAIQEV